MNATQLAAWVGASSGLGSLFWNIYTKVTAGPRLRVTAYADNVMKPKVEVDDPHYLRVTVQNVGTQTTTVTNVTFHRYESRWKRLRHRSMNPALLMNFYNGLQLPQKVEVGMEWSASMTQNEEFDEWVRYGLWCAVHHSFARRPVEVRICSPLLK
jgi:hypothetical protein